MARSPFGWSYPAGAENDPNAPYNQEPEPEECPACGKENADADDSCFPFCSQKCADEYSEV